MAVAVMISTNVRDEIRTWSLSITGQRR